MGGDGDRDREIVLQEQILHTSTISVTTVDEYAIVIGQSIIQTLNAVVQFVVLQLKITREKRKGR